MRPSKTYFEQVPLELVKKIATEFFEANADDKVRRPATENLTHQASGLLLHDAIGGGETMPTYEAEGDQFTYPEWEQPLRAMMLELDKDKLKARVAEAEAAIFNRQQAISRTADHESEKQAIEDALSLLRAFKRTQLGFPDWEEEVK